MGLGIVLNRNRQVPAEDSPAFGAIAERFRRAGDLERAVALCQEGLAKFPGHLSARVTLGWSYLDLGKYDEARAELEQVLKRAPDNLAAIRGLAELHDRAEHDEMAAMHRDGSKWMTEAAAAAVPEPTHAVQSSPVESRYVAPAPTAAEASVTPSRPTPAPTHTPAPKAAIAAPVDDELEAGIAALGVLSGTASGPSAPASPTPASPSFAAPTTPEPVAPKAKPVASTFAAPTKAEIASTADDTSPWQPVEIESAAAHLLEATSSSAWKAPVEPARAAAPAIPAAWQPEPAAVEETTSFAAPTADLGIADLSAAAAEFPEFAEFASLDDAVEAAAPVIPAPAQSAFPASEPVAQAVAPVAAARAAESAPAPVARAEHVPVVELSAMAPVAADTPTLIQPRVSSLEELDPELPALVDDAWSEQQDVYVLPAAVEAERAIADEGPGVWPPVIPDDPVEAPIAAREAAPAPVPAVEPAPARRASVSALNKFLRRVENRRSAVVAEYLAG